MTRFFTTVLLALALTLAQLGLSSPAWALYRIDYGDTITITVKDAAQYSFSGAIRPDGAITVPFVGDFEVAGLTPAQVGERVTKLLAKVLRDPQVSVTVTTFRGRVVSLFGQVAHAGNATIPPAPVNPTVLDAISQAGGFTDRANRTEVLLIRGEGANAQRYVVNVEEMLRTGNFSNNLVLQDRDVIMVPEVWYPDYRQVVGVIGTVASVITMITLIANTYNRASGQ